MTALISYKLITFQTKLNYYSYANALLTTTAIDDKLIFTLLKSPSNQNKSRKLTLLKSP